MMTIATYCMDCGNDFTTERTRCTDTDCGYCKKCCICWDRELTDEDKPTPAPAIEEEPAERARCLHCERVIERMADSDEWTAAMIGVNGRDGQCRRAPNPNDGPMPNHSPAPGTVVANPSA